MAFGGTFTPRVLIDCHRSAREAEKLNKTFCGIYWAIKTSEIQEPRWGFKPLGFGGDIETCNPE